MEAFVERKFSSQTKRELRQATEKHLILMEKEELFEVSDVPRPYFRGSLELGGSFWR